MKSERPPVDIVVPIYNARNDVKKCVESVLRHASGDYALVLVDDCSTDAELVHFLDDSARADSRVVVLRPEKNGGFVQSANLGMQHSVDEGKKRGVRRDVLLLNSDTIVTPEFLERIQACAYCDKKTGIVSPFSNNATICSLPKFCSDNPVPENLDEYARTISRTSRQERPEIVTAVGFCMYIRGEVIQKIGLFNSIYGRGFGEENDYCEVAKNAGFLIRLADDVFVAHTGKASFGAEGRALEHANMKVLLERFPYYMDEVAYFCETNPLLGAQANANYFTRRDDGVRYPAVLHIVHSSPFSSAAGGSEHYVFDVLRGMRAPRALVAYPDAGGISVAEVYRGDVTQPVLHHYPLRGAAPKMCYEHAEISAVIDEVIRVFDVGIAHIHHLFHWPVSIWRVLAARKVPYFYTVHDYYAVCPSHNLFDYSSMASCPCVLEPGSTKSCLSAYAATAHTDLPGLDAAAVESHRAHFRELLRNAAGVIGPSRKALSLVEERCGAELKSFVLPHGYDVRAEDPGDQVGGYSALKIAVLGNVNYPNKGAANYLEAVRRTRHTGVEWHFFGDIRAFGYEEQLKAAGDSSKLFFHGPYERREIVSLLRETGIQLIVLLPACHETFSFTLSEALIAGIPPIALAVGSLEERLRDAGLESCLCKSTAHIVERISYYATCRDELARLTERVSHFRHTTTSQCAAELLMHYGEAGAGLFRRDEPLEESLQRVTFEAHMRVLRPSEREPVPLLSVDRYRPGWWTPIARRLGSLVRGIDESLKEQFLRQRVRVVQSFPFRSFAKLCALSPDTEILKEQSKAVAFRANGRDPFLIFPAGSPGGSRIQTDAVDCLRLRIRCETSRRTRAQLFWTHAADEAFSEGKSCHIPLRRTSDWQDVVLDLRSWGARERWSGLPEIFQLRLDPLDCEGYFELRDLTFAKFQGE